MAEIYTIISIAAFSLAGVFFLLSCIFWFKFGIMKIIGDLSGRTAKKSIEQMRAQNEKTGRKDFRPTPAARERGKLTETIEKQERKSFESEDTASLDSMATEPLDINEPMGTELLQENTEVLNDSDIDGKIEEIEILDSITLIHSQQII